MAHPTQQPVLFEEAFTKRLEVAFDADGLTSDGGMPLLIQMDHELGLTRQMSEVIADNRQSGKISHEVEEMLQQRIFSIAAGYADCTDAGRLAEDPALKLACGRDPLGGPRLASQPTLSRLETRITAHEAMQMNRRLEDMAVAEFVRRHPSPGRITIDFDPSVDPTHGGQQGTLFNGFYGSWCYLPVLGFLSCAGSTDHQLFMARLRPGTAKECRAVIPTIRRVVRKLREAYGRKLSILIRLDSGFFNPLLLDVLDELDVKYVVGMPNNKKLNRWAKRRLPRARRLARERGRAARVFDERKYKAGSWSAKRRVILKAEAIPYYGRALKDNPRFVVTNLTAKAKQVYEGVYCKRGDPENRIKELKHGLQIDRTSCSGFVANQFRVTMTASAYMLFQQLRWHLRKTGMGKAQVSRLRTMLVKVAARVTESVRRIVFHLPTTFPFTREWERAGLAVGARLREAPA